MYTPSNLLLFGVTSYADSQSLLRGDGPWAWTHDGHVIESFELTTTYHRTAPNLLLPRIYYFAILAESGQGQRMTTRGRYSRETLSGHMLKSLVEISSKKAADVDGLKVKIEFVMICSRAGRTTYFRMSFRNKALKGEMVHCATWLQHTAR